MYVLIIIFAVLHDHTNSIYDLLIFRSVVFISVELISVFTGMKWIRMELFSFKRSKIS